jgi:hypothetical protein
VEFKAQRSVEHKERIRSNSAVCSKPCSRVTYENSAYGNPSGSIESSDVLFRGTTTLIVDVTPAGEPQSAPSAVDGRFRWWPS